ncbi:hypothetical protein J3458_009133 [Metarhizium acridum]|uniref:uncharacterized protein n=1 Tax=Metarhizium acridum TaxID=92637 RepID=UPI001C6D2119|nr:hypothetical protein J3458_009133 [Metarhizium acridum]
MDVELTASIKIDITSARCKGLKSGVDFSLMEPETITSLPHTATTMTGQEERGGVRPGDTRQGSIRRPLKGNGNGCNQPTNGPVKLDNGKSQEGLVWQATADGR